jgi:ABC-type spermidine/putrescine transport system permease subunit II
VRTSGGTDPVAATPAEDPTVPAEAAGARRAPGDSRWAVPARWTFLVIVMLILYGPLLVLALFSVNDSIVIALPFKGFTLEWYRQALSNTLVRESIKNSLAVALVVTPVSLLLGTMGAFATTRFRYRGRGGVAALTAGPLVVPWLLIGVGALLFFSRLDVPLNLRTIGAMHVVVAFPLVAAIVSARLVRFEVSLEEAARDLGATNREVLRYIVLPHLTPALAAAAILAFSYSFNNFVLSFFVGGFELTFPIWVFSTLRHAQNVPIVNAISTLVSALQVIVVVAAWRLWRRRTERTGGGGDEAAELLW